MARCRMKTHMTTSANSSHRNATYATCTNQYAVPMRLSGQVAIVRGGAQGIGGGISRRLAAAGAHVVLNDINANAASATRAEIAAAGGHCTTVVGDIRDRNTVAEVRDTALAVGSCRTDSLTTNDG